MDRCEVAVVGGGPAGSACARRLHEAGLDVLVLDRAVFPRSKPCGGWITPPVLDALELAPDAYADGRTLQAFTGFRTGSIGGPVVDTDYGEAVSFGILRYEFDRFLLERSGARLRTGFPVSRLSRDGDCWIVDDQVAAQVLVGAGGHFCPVARLLSEPRSGRSLVVAQELEFRLDVAGHRACRVVPEVPELYFCSDLLGYGWCVRKGDYLNVGLGRRDPRGLGAHVRAFVALMAREGRIPSELPARWQGHAYWLREKPARPVVGDGLLLVGDAAGLAVPTSGEGIRPAVESGLLAADVLIAARGRHSREDLEPYAKALRARFGPPGRRLELPTPMARPLGRLLLKDRWFTRRFVLDRWFLQRSSAGGGSRRGDETPAAGVASYQ